MLMDQLSPCQNKGASLKMLRSLIAARYKYMHTAGTELGGDNGPLCHGSNCHTLVAQPCHAYFLASIYCTVQSRSSNVNILGPSHLQRRSQHRIADSERNVVRLPQGEFSRSLDEVRTFYSIYSISKCQS